MVRTRGTNIEQLLQLQYANWDVRCTHTVKNVWGNVQCGKRGGFRGNTTDLQAFKTVFGSDFCYKLLLLLLHYFLEELISVFSYYKNEKSQVRF